MRPVNEHAADPALRRFRRHSPAEHAVGCVAWRQEHAACMPVELCEGCCMLVACSERSHCFDAMGPGFAKAFDAA